MAKLLKREQMNTNQKRNYIIHVIIGLILALSISLFYCFDIVLPEVNNLGNYIESDKLLSKQTIDFQAYYGAVILIGTCTPIFLLIIFNLKVYNMIEFLFFKLKIDMGFEKQKVGSVE